jgi:hypothetical protein
MSLAGAAPRQSGGGTPAGLQSLPSLSPPPWLKGRRSLRIDHWGSSAPSEDERMEKAAYAILLGLTALWILAIVAGSIAAFPVGLIGLLVLVAVGLLFVKVVKERLSNKEDQYYSDNVEK